MLSMWCLERIAPWVAHCASVLRHFDTPSLTALNAQQLISVHVILVLERFPLSDHVRIIGIHHVIMWLDKHLQTPASNLTTMACPGDSRGESLYRTILAWWPIVFSVAPPSLGKYVGRNLQWDPYLA